MNQIDSILCSACESPCSKPIASVTDHEYQSSLSIYNFLECPNCFTLKIQPVPSASDLKAAYPKEYYSFHLIENYLKYKNSYWGKKFYSSLRAAFISEFKSWSLLLNRNYKDLRILDYGTGEGFTLQILSEIGIKKDNLFGYEPHSTASNVYQNFNIISKHSDLKELKEKFDIVLASHVIEHLNNPKELLEDCTNIISEGGLLIITMPTPEGIHYKLTARHHWGGYHAPRHLNILTCRGLNHIVKKFPFSIISTRALDDSWIIAQTLNSIMTATPNYLVPDWFRNSITAGDKEKPTFARAVLYKILSIVSRILIRIKKQSSNTQIILQKNALK